VFVLLRTKALVVSALAAATLATALPASAVDTAAIAINPCRGDVGLVWEEWHQTIQVTGVYAQPRAVDVQLTCGVVRYGETVGRVTENAPGPVAVVSGSVRTLRGPVTFCHEIVVTYLTHYEWIDTCP
jgi:hypothetical protein